MRRRRSTRRVRERLIFSWLSSQALEKYNVEKDIAAYLKKEFDRKHGATWHAIVGRNFGSYVTHESGYFIYFYVGHVSHSKRVRFRECESPIAGVQLDCFTFKSLTLYRRRYAQVALLLFKAG